MTSSTTRTTRTIRDTPHATVAFDTSHTLPRSAADQQSLRVKIGRIGWCWWGLDLYHGVPICLRGTCTVPRSRMMHWHQIFRWYLSKVGKENSPSYVKCRGKMYLGGQKFSKIWQFLLAATSFYSSRTTRSHVQELTGQIFPWSEYS